MIGVGFIIRGLQLALYCGVGALLLFFVFFAITWIVRLFIVGTEATMQDHLDWVKSKLPKRRKRRSKPVIDGK